MKDLKGINYLSLSVAAMLMIGCSSSKPYQAKYEAAWQDLVESEAWEASLNQTEPENDVAGAGADENIWLSGNNTISSTGDPFQADYDSWVHQAYFKIITEAEEADSRIKSEYQRFLAENPDAADSSDENVVRILSMYKKKYQAHEIMLAGLKSWHAFDEFGSDDLKFFKQEYEQVIRSMYRRGQKEEHIVDYLVYKLADLYHLDADSTK